MKLWKVLRRKIVVVLLLGLIGLTGCANLRPVVLHPIQDSDIFEVPAGTQIGERVTDKAGYFVSEFYLEEVARARIGK